MIRLPASGRPHADVLAELAAARGGDVDWRHGKTWSLVYPGGDEHEALIREAGGLFTTTNGLNPMAFPSLRRLEREVVQMSAGLMNGPSTTVGVMTSGGTESILLAVKTARDRMKRRNPEVLAAETVHPAFDKACDLFGLKLRLVPVDRNYRADVRAMKKAITRNTVLIVGSAPQYPHGIIDPIEEIAALGVPMHVDACVGGFLLPFLDNIPTWDFRVPGVVSISADLHKYGYAPKGASVLLFRDMAAMRALFFVYTRWPGGIYASATLPGSRPGAPIASAWASMMGLGRDGYRALAAEALTTARRLRDGIRAIPGLDVVGDPQVTIVAWTSKDPDVDLFAIADQLAAKGWSVDRQQRPACIHNTVNASNGPFVDQYLADVREAVDTVRGRPELSRKGDAAIYGLTARIPVPLLAKPAILGAMEKLYGVDDTPGDLGPSLPKPVQALVDRYVDWQRRRESRR